MRTVQFFFFDGTEFTFVVVTQQGPAVGLRGFTFALFDVHQSPFRVVVVLPQSGTDFAGNGTHIAAAVATVAVATVAAAAATTASTTACRPP